jgi:cytoskeletal protein RodZ
LLVDETNTEPLVDANEISDEQDSVAGFEDEATVALETEEGDLSSQSVGEPTLEPESSSPIISEVTDTAGEENSPPSVRVKEVGSGQYTLALDFSDSCWIEVVDLDGNVIDADLYSPSRRLVVQFDEPIEVLLGYAPAVTATLNEEPLTFRIPPSEIVRLTLPQGDL